MALSHRQVYDVFFKIITNSTINFEHVVSWFYFRSFKLDDVIGDPSITQFNTIGNFFILEYTKLFVCKILVLSHETCGSNVPKY